MHANAFDRYQVGNSPLHRIDARVKVTVTVLFILSNVLLPDGAWIAFLLSWALVLAANVASGLGAGFSLRRSFVAIPFALVAVTALFAIPGKALASFQFGPWHLIITQPGLLRFTSILIRSWLSLQMAILLVATTQFPDLLHALRHLHVPDILVAIISFMYRYLFVLADEALRLMRARLARSGRMPEKPGAAPIGWRARVAGNMAGQLFLRSYERSDRIYNAMQARGYQGQLLTLNPHRLQAQDWIAGSAALAAILVVQIAGRLL